MECGSVIVVIFCFRSYNLHFADSVWIIRIIWAKTKDNNNDASAFHQNNTSSCVCSEKLKLSQQNFGSWQELISRLLASVLNIVRNYSFWVWWIIIVNNNSTRKEFNGNKWLQQGLLVNLRANDEVEATKITSAPNVRFMDIRVETSGASRLRAEKGWHQIVVAASSWVSKVLFFV